MLLYKKLLLMTFGTTYVYHGYSWNAASIKLVPCFHLHHIVSAHNPVGSHKKRMLVQSD
jgi:hypothetical protein